MATHSEKAGQIADAFLESSEHDKRYHNDDDRMTAHYTSKLGKTIISHALNLLKNPKIKVQANG